jgi:NitT/TauT family transport system substrate-binding protein
MFADAIDATYIGPNPAINGHLKSGGKVFAIVAGSASGGAALVIRTDAGIDSDRDFDGKTIATPQLGNTQDVAARAWFKSKNHRLKEKGGSLILMPLQNPDQLQMFKQKEIHGAWTIEPWVSRLVHEGGGKVFLEEKDLWPAGRYVTTHLIVSRKFMREHPDTVRRLIAAHIAITQQLNGEGTKIGSILQAELKRETGAPLSDAVLESALKRVEFTWDPIRESLVQSAKAAHEAGFIKQSPNLEGIYDLTMLNTVLREHNLPPVP